MTKTGKVKRVPKEAAINFNAEPSLKAQFEKIAITEDRSVSAVYRDALKAFLKSREPSAAAAA